MFASSQIMLATLQSFLEAQPTSVFDSNVAQLPIHSILFYKALLRFSIFNQCFSIQHISIQHFSNLSISHSTPLESLSNQHFDTPQFNISQINASRINISTLNSTSPLLSPTPLESTFQNFI